MAKPILGTKGNDTLKGGNGNDHLIGKAGNDDVRGGNGNDFVQGGPGNDVAGGANGADKVFGGPGNDTVNGGHGSDFLFGGSGDDRLTGGGQTGAGDDVDIMKGGSGADTFRIDATGDDIVILDFKYKHGDRIDLAAQYSLSDAVITDNGNPHEGVTITFYSGGVAGTSVTILGVNDVSDVSSDWFI